MRPGKSYERAEAADGMTNGEAFTEILCIDRALFYQGRRGSGEIDVSPEPLLWAPQRLAQDERQESYPLSCLSSTIIFPICFFQ